MNYSRDERSESQQSPSGTEVRYSIQKREHWYRGIQQLAQSNDLVNTGVGASNSQLFMIKTENILSNFYH